MNICEAVTGSLFSRTTDISLSNYSGDVCVKRDAIALMRHPCLMAGSPGRPVRALLTDKRSNKKF